MPSEVWDVTLIDRERKVCLVNTNHWQVNRTFLLERIRTERKRRDREKREGRSKRGLDICSLSNTKRNVFVGNTHYKSVVARFLIFFRGTPYIFFWCTARRKFIIEGQSVYNGC